MQGSNTVNGESVVDIHMCHVNQIIFVNDGYIFLWIFCFDFLIQFFDDRYKVRNYIKKVVHRPFFQSFCEDGMVCVSTYFGYNLSSFVEVDSALCQETDQFRNDHTWVSIVDLDHCVVCKVMQVAFRTQAEGGEAALTADQYAAFCAAVCASGCADLLDIEFFSAGKRLPQWIAAAHAAGVKVVCSSHDFQKTPPRTELVERMLRMQQAGADLPKLAVMPTCRTDVLELLAATAEMADHHPETPVITMSMGALGAVSRLCGEAFGSSMTFANPGTASAPGQVPLDVVDTVLDSLRLS